MTEPTRRLRIHVLQVAYGDLESVDERIDRVATLVSQQDGADLVVLPELWAPGAFAFTTWPDQAQHLDGPVVEAVSAAARRIRATVHAGSIVERDFEAAVGPAGRPPMWNTSVVVGPAGQVVATYRKIHRFGFDSGESLLLEAGDQLVTAPVLAPDGDTLATLGLATCYDLRFPELFRMLLDAGSDVLVVPAAWPAARVEHWTLLGRARALENQCVVVQANTAGTHAGVTMGGHSQVVAADGTVLARAGADADVLVVDVDLAELAAFRASFPVLADRRLPVRAGARP